MILALRESWSHFKPQQMSFVSEKKRCKIGVSSRNLSKIAPIYSCAKLVYIKHLHLETRDTKKKKILSVGDGSPAI